MPGHALLCAIALTAPAADADDAPAAQEREAQARPRDAAEAVQEGNVTQWLEHYQRERGEDWAKQKSGNAGEPPSATPAAPPPAK
jgi:hypothetical protein